MGAGTALRLGQSIVRRAHAEQPIHMNIMTRGHGAALCWWRDRRTLTAPLPTLRKSSRLPLRHAHHQAVELFGHLDLAREPRARPHVVAEVEHVLLHRRGTARALAPGIVDIDMAGRAGAGAAALGLDAGHVVLDRGFHHGRAELAFDLVGSSVRADEGDLGHGRTHMVRLPAERRAASYNGLWRDAPDRASAPLPKFVCRRGNLWHELRKQRALATLNCSAALRFEVPN